MERYVGLDVSLKQTAICVVNQAGSIVQEGVVDSDPEAIAGFMRSKAPGAVRIGIETGPTTTWLWTELKRLGLPVICIDARHAKAVLKMQINKSDRNDAAGIARIMQTGWFKEVRVKDLDSHAVKALLASGRKDGNELVVEKRNRLVARIIHRKRANPEIERICLQHLQRRCCQASLETDLQLRVISLELPQDRRKHVHRRKYLLTHEVRSARCLNQPGGLCAALSKRAVD